MPVTTIDREYKANEKIENEGIEEKHISKGTTFAENYEVVSDSEKKGGMGQVILCKSRLDNKYYVLKKILKEEYKGAFEKEIKIALKLEKNPYIVYTQTAIEENNELYMVMELVGSQSNINIKEWGNNVTLFDILKKEKIELKEKFKWMIEFCRGMQYLNSIGIEIHQDIKPANIFITEDRHVKIGDFGLATTNGRKKGGTKLYQAPEFNNTNDDEKLTNKSDIYSFGVVLYEIFSDGKNPYSEKRVLADYVLRNPIEFKDDNELKVDIKDIIYKCGQENPNDRYENFTKIEEDLLNAANKKFGDDFKIEQLETEKYSALDLYFKGNGYYNIRQFNEAITCYDQAIYLNKQESLFYYGKANSLYSLGLKNEAIMNLNFAIQIDPIKDMEYYFKRGILKYESELYKDAIKDFRISIEFNKKLNNSIDPKIYFFMAQSEYELEEYNRALEYCDNFLGLDSQNYEIYCLKGRIYIKLQKYDKAIENFDISIKIIKEKSVDNYTDAYYYRGLAKYKIKQFDQAMKDLNLVIKRKEGGDKEDYYNYGYCYYACKQYKEAINNFNLAIDIALKEKEKKKKRTAKKKNKFNELKYCYYLRGMSNYHLKEYDLAENDFDEAIKEDPSFLQAYLDRGKIENEENKYTKALKDFDKVLTLDSENIEALFLSGKIKFKLKEYENSIDFYNKVIELDPFYDNIDYDNIYLERAKSKKELNRIDEAIKDYDTVMKLKPQCAQNYFEMAMLNVDLKNEKKALQCFNEAIKIDSKFAQAYYERGKLNIVLNNSDNALQDFYNYSSCLSSPENIDKDFYFYRGKAYYKSQKYGSAISDFSTITETNGHDMYISAYYYIGKANYNLANYDQAIKDFTELIKKDSKNSYKYYYKRGQAKKEKNLIDDAIKDFTKAIDKNKNFSDAYFERGKLYSQSNKILQANKDYDKVIQIDPKNLSALFEKATLEKTLNKEKEASADFTKVIEKNPTNAQEFYIRGKSKLYIKPTNLENVLNDFNEAIRIMQTNSEKIDSVIYFDRGRVNFKLGYNYESLKDFDIYEKLSKPENIIKELYYYRGRVNYKLYNDEKAINDFDKYLKYIQEKKKGLWPFFSKPKDKNAIKKGRKTNYNKGLSLLRQDKYEEALECFKKAIKETPKYLQAYLKIGETYIKLDEYESAIEYLEKVMEKDKYNVEAFNLLNRILKLSQDEDIKEKIRQILIKAGKLVI